MAYDEGTVVLDEHARAGRAGHAAGEERGVALSGVDDDEGSSSELLGSVFILCESQAVGVLCDKAVNHWPELSQDHVHVPGSGLASIQSLPV